jgi:ubiquitin C-terminal hydrolase
MTASPQVLVVTLKRWNIIGEKLKTKVRPSLRVVLAGQAYTLKSVLVHTGPRAGRGHYTAFIKASHGWFLADDSTVFHFPLLPDYVASTGYGYFFERESAPEHASLNSGKFVNWLAIHDAYLSVQYYVALV